MTGKWRLEDVAALSEGVDVECKAAQGRDGRGEVPDDFWKSYSAMANGEGGVIWLGIQEKPRGNFSVLGLADVERVRKTVWDCLHNRQKISANLLSDVHVQPLIVDGKTVLQIDVPRATRKDKPVHIGGNPFGGTYLRRHEGDYQADDETVRRILAERVEDSRDDRVLKNFGFNDLDMETVAAYRNRFSAVKPGHVWSDLPVEVFLERIGAYGTDREKGHGGLRIAGLLMFGRAEVVRDALPYYMVDYQERPEARTEKRWVDRLVPDGSWSGNLYDFFRRVYQKLTADLKVPFQLKEGQRIDDSPVHEALREALVNTLIHADYTGRVSVMVVKRPDMFGFRNPGRMRIPPEIAVHGGNSDCRNRRLQTMFQQVGYGDHAGSGLPKIYSNWAGQHWSRPILYELAEPEQTLMELRMSSLVPEQAVAEIVSHLGDQFWALPELARLALVTAQSEGVVSHARLREMSTEHPTDITKMLAGLVRNEMLVSYGAGRGTVYCLPWQEREPKGLFETTGSRPESPELHAKPPELHANTPELHANTPELSTESQERVDEASSKPDAPILDWSSIAPSEQARLSDLALPVSSNRHARKEVLQGAVLALCRGQYLGTRVLAQLLSRDPDDLRKRTLNPMVKAGQLKAAYPAANDPRQAYTAADKASE
ncbi:RNA-binding domain-containing protein [Hydrocarboniphaga sp.]|uniref:RNA-binding domain-containing protein n=1 Tax=Hydrocarboniphaga sp. TaxID=2033016 RepID=UPI002AB82609|nr:RNA-binding domain-containing protein [Hydrocarboniphaga sp.]MDZ4079731.1 putative DNA binding domain-containing protein [Hydrocarboniphaga sp.]